MMEMKVIIKAAKKAGWKVDKRSSGHVLFYPPNKAKGIVTGPSTPSDYRGMKNMRARLKKAGLKL